MNIPSSRTPYTAFLSVLPRPLQRTLTKTMKRASDVEPERGHAVGTDGQSPVVEHDRGKPCHYSTDPVRSGATTSCIVVTGLAPVMPSLLTLNCAVALFISAFAFTDARNGGAGINTRFLPALLLMFAPIAVRLLLPATVRVERIWLLCAVGLTCYFIKLVSSPLYFSFFDEFLHWRTVDDIARSGHLFTANALLPVSPYYPGLEIVTNALSRVSGLNTFYAGLVVIGISRLLMVLALFMLYERILKSARVASLATLLYMINPHFLLFDAQYGYESLSLPLATLMLFALSPHQSVSVRLTRLEPLASMVKFSKTGRNYLHRDLRWITLTAWLVLVAIVFTHHVTDFFFDALLIIWTIIYASKRLTPLYQSNLARTAFIGVAISIVSAIRIGNPVVTYLASFMGVALSELGHILSGTGSAKQLFVNYSGPPTPIWERIVTVSSMGLIVLCLPFGLLCLWHRYRANALACTFGFFSLLYPVSQAFRLTTTGSEVADRAAAFLFIPIASVLAIFIVQFWPIARLRWIHTAFLASAMSFVFLGGILLGAGPASALLPGPYEVTADSRSIEPEGIQAAVWSHTYLQPDSRLVTDRINQVLMGTYGDQHIVTSIEDAVDLSPVFLLSSITDEDILLLHKAHIQYVVTDMRLTQSLPLLGFYYEMGETGAFHHKTPIDRKAFAKFDTAPQIQRLFDSGDIVVYDVRGLRNAYQQ